MARTSGIADRIWSGPLAAKPGLAIFSHGVGIFALFAGVVAFLTDFGGCRMSAGIGDSGFGQYAVGIAQAPDDFVNQNLPIQADIFAEEPFENMDCSGFLNEDGMS